MQKLGAKGPVLKTREGAAGITRASYRPDEETPLETACPIWPAVFSIVPFPGPIVIKRSCVRVRPSPKNGAPVFAETRTSFHVGVIFPLETMTNFISSCSSSGSLPVELPLLLSLVGAPLERTLLEGSNFSFSKDSRSHFLIPSSLCRRNGEDELGRSEGLLGSR